MGTEWFALLIPLIFGGLFFTVFKKALVWWELLLPASFAVLFILGFKGCVETSLITDNEYWGDLITEARYYESWETWKVEECSRRVSCGQDYTTDSKGNRTYTTRYCTEYYDCSHCEEHSAYWVGRDTHGNEVRITQDHFNKLITKWSATPQKGNLGRNINYSHGCGRDGNVYSIVWDDKPKSAETVVTEHSYTNKIQASHSSFKLESVSAEEATKLGLHPYPTIYEDYKQRAVLGLESIYGGDSLEVIESVYQWFNGYYGPKNKVKLFVCLFYDKPYSISFKQEAYWEGGNQNELVVCIGLNKATRQLQWVRPFSWTKDKRVLVDIREDVMNLKTFQPLAVFEVIKKSVGGDMHRSFHRDFDYLDVDLPSWAMWVLYVVVFLATLGINIWSVGNEYQNEDETPQLRNMNGYIRCKKKTFTERLKEKFQAAWERLNKK